MGLFSVLTSQASDESIKKTSSSSSSLDLPTMVQLYRSKPFRLERQTKMPSYSVLSYSAVSTQKLVVDAAEARRKRNKQQQQLVPELGVWNCHVAERTSPLKDAALQIPDSASMSSFCLAVDLSVPSQVEPTLTLLQDALVRFLIARPAAEATTTIMPENSKVASTTLYDLRSVQFGLAPNDQEASDKLAAPHPDDRKVAIALVICARVPAKKPTTEEDYRNKQEQALLFYHLRRYASALKANLCFVRYDEDDDDDEEEPEEAGEQPALTTHQLACVWRDLAMLQEPQLLKEHSPVNQSDDETPFSILYGPSNHNEELIESVLLRNANYPGEWDAAQQSLWKILPPLNDAAATESKSAIKAGDGHWLAELRDSIASEPVKTPPRTTKDSKEPASTQKTPNDAAVSSFFENLLK